ncbi:MAG: phosphoribosylamine--glycine ligase [bacterium]|nr:phosphoribosylamine--glycine ligase [bacterium]
MRFMKTVLIVDGGGRGSALVYKYSESSSVGKIIAVPGNDLMQFNSKKKVETYSQVKVTDVEEIVRICKKEKVDLVDVGQEDAIEAGIVNRLLEEGFLVSGPTREAARIEWDKAWAREFMKKYKLPSPKFFVFYNENIGIKFLKTARDGAWFVKANGLLGGKGALPAKDNKEAVVRIKELKKFGKAGETYLLEEWLVGEEFSSFALTDGKTHVLVGSAQDHKRMFNFDQGENTGGIGCSSPPLVIDTKIKKQIEDIFKKTFAGLKKEKIDYKGVLYLGGIVVRGQVYIIEFNARWGDPEAEVLLPSIKTDMFKISQIVAKGGMSKLKIKFDNLSRVVVTGHPRPGISAKGKEVFGLALAKKIDGVMVFGTRVSRVGKRYFAGEGRLFHIMGEGRNVIEAREKAYRAMSLISIEGNNLHYRTDIGWRDVERFWYH